MYNSLDTNVFTKIHNYAGSSNTYGITFEIRSKTHVGLHVFLLLLSGYQDNKWLSLLSGFNIN